MNRNTRGTRIVNAVARLLAAGAPLAGCASEHHGSPAAEKLVICTPRQGCGLKKAGDTPPVVDSEGSVRISKKECLDQKGTVKEEVPAESPAPASEAATAVGEVG